MIFRVLDSTNNILPIEADDHKWAAELWYDLVCLFPVSAHTLYPIMVFDEAGEKYVWFDNVKSHSQGKKARSERLDLFLSSLRS
jgi:hypothetical protein